MDSGNRGHHFVSADIQGRSPPSIKLSRALVLKSPVERVRPEMSSSGSLGPSFFAGNCTLSMIARETQAQPRAEKPAGEIGSGKTLPLAAGSERGTVGWFSSHRKKTKAGRRFPATLSSIETWSPREGMKWKPGARWTNAKLSPCNPAAGPLKAPMNRPPFFVMEREPGDTMESGIKKDRESKETPVFHFIFPGKQFPYHRLCSPL